MNIDEIIDSIYRLPDQAKEKLKKITTVKEYKKGDRIIKMERVDRRFYFMKKGLARAYADIEGNEVTFLFFKEGDVLLSLNSYTTETRGYETIELLENSDLYVLDIQLLFDLYLQDINISNWGRKMVEKQLILSDKRLIIFQFYTAGDRYKQFVKENPELIKRVPLKYIASYLGVNQASLSRIRGELD